MKFAAIAALVATASAAEVATHGDCSAKDATCTTPESLITGMNKFLRLMDITFRRDPTNYRPRINKHQSQKDQEQKSAGNYFLMDDSKLTKEEEEEEKAAAASGAKAAKGDKGGAKKEGGPKKGKKDKDN